jgi:hypothetical protein
VIGADVETAGRCRVWKDPLDEVLEEMQVNMVLNNKWSQCTSKHGPK